MSNVTSATDPAVTSRCGNAKSFNGTTSHVRLPWTTLGSSTLSAGQQFLAPGPNGEFSAEAWFKTTAVSKALFVFRWFGYGLNIGADGKLRGYAYTAATTQNPVFSKAAVNNNVWHHVVLTKNASTLVLYVDGVEQSTIPTFGPVFTAAVPSPTPPGSGGVSIGRDGDGPTTGFGMDVYAGSMDEVAFYDKALTKNDVFNHANAGGFTLAPAPVTTSQGAQTGAPAAADPVTVSSGNFYDTWTDLPAQNAVPGLNWSRSYNSLSTTVGVLGVGWSTPVEQTVIVQGDGTALWTDATGRQVAFAPVAANWVAKNGGTTTQLVRRGDTSFALLWTDGSSTEFDLSGRVEQFVSWTGVTATIARTGAVANTITASTGEVVTLTYTSGRLTGVASSDGRSVTYGFNAQQNLSSVTDAAAKVWLITADAAGLVTKVTDPAGVVIVETVFDTGRRAIKQYAEGGSAIAVPVFFTFVYDNVARTTTMTSSVDASVATYLWDVDWNVYASIDKRGKVVTNTFDQGGFLAGVTDRSGISTGATFDDRGRPLSTVGADGLTSTQVYDPSGRVTSVTVPGVGTTTYTYETTERIPATTTTPDGKVTTITAGTDGLVTQTVDPDGVTTSFTYWPSRLVKTRTDGVGHTTSFDYDTAGRLTKTTYPDTTFTQTTYDGAGRVLTSRGPDGGVTTTTYDNAGRVLTVTDPLGKVTTNHYDAKGRLDWVLPAGLPDPAGRTTFTYDDFNELLTTTRPGGSTTTNTYDIEGRLTSVTDPMGRVTSYGYDDEGRPTTVTAPDGGVTTTVYDTAGRAWKTIDPLGLETVNAFNGLGQLASVTAPGGRITTYGYDAVGRQSTVTSPLGGVTTTTYTNGGRVDTVTDAAGVVTDNTYNLAGQLTSASVGGKVTGYAYDLNGRPSQTTAPTGPVTTYATTYNATGKIETTTAPSGVVSTRQFNKRGELVSEATSGQGTVSYTYNDSGTMASTTDAVGKVTTFGYDNRLNRTSRTNALSGVDSWGFNLADEQISSTDPLSRVTTSATTYTTSTRVDTSTDASGRTMTRTYDRAGRLVETRASQTGKSDEYTTYAYNDNGTYCWTLTSTTPYVGTPSCAGFAPGGAALYAWNSAGQLTRHISPESRVSENTYDTAGRLTSRVVPDGQQFNYTYKTDGTGRLDTVTPRWTIVDSFPYANTNSLDTAKWNAKTVVSGGDALVSFGALALSHTATAGSSVSVTSKMPSAADVEVSTRLLVWDNTVASRFELAARYVAGGTGGSYRIEFDTGTTTAKVIRKVGTVNTQLGTFTVPSSFFGTSFKLRVQGARVQARVWSGTEPTTWDFDVTDSAPWSTAGQLRVTWSRLSGSTARNVAVEEFRGFNLASPPATLAAYTYNNDGNVTAEILVGGSRTWTYSPTTGQVTGFTQTLPGANKTTTLAYDTSGRLRTETNGTNRVWFAYDNAGQLCYTLANTSATGPTNTCAAPPTGTGASTWSYDDLGRRASEKLGTATKVWYRYDAASQPCWTVAAAANPANTCASAPAGATTYTYDQAGRQLAQTVTATDSVASAYDVAGRLATLTRVSGATTTTQTRVYDSVTNLAGKMTNTTGATSSYTYYDWTRDPLPELAGIQRTPTATTPSSTVLVSSPVTGNWIGQQAGPTVLSLAQDVYGSTIAATGTTLQRSSTYNVWGTPTGTNTLEARLGYRGELTIDTGINLRARTYMPTIGQLTSKDPVLGDPGSSVIADPYAYANNSPINYTDPTGMTARNTTTTVAAPPSSPEVSIGDRVASLCQARSGKMVVYGQTGSSVCLEPPASRKNGDSCWPSTDTQGNAIVWNDGYCAVRTTTMGCRVGDNIPGLHQLCKHSAGITQGLWVVAGVAGAVATGGALVQLGPVVGVYFGGGGGALALAGGGTLSGGIVVSEALAVALQGGAGIAALSSSIHQAAGQDGSQGANRADQEVQRGQAPKGIERVDKADPRIPGSQDHVHFTGQRATLNRDGTWGHGGGELSLTPKQIEWLRARGWNV